MTKKIRFPLVISCASRRNAKTGRNFSRRRKSVEYSKRRGLDRKKRGCGEKQKGENGKMKIKHGKEKRRLWKRSEGSDNTLRRSQQSELGVKPPVRVSTYGLLCTRQALVDHAKLKPHSRLSLYLIFHEDTLPNPASRQESEAHHTQNLQRVLTHQVSMVVRQLQVATFLRVRHLSILPIQPYHRLRICSIGI